MNYIEKLTCLKKNLIKKLRSYWLKNTKLWLNYVNYGKIIVKLCKLW